jgi:hypothetical protein
MHSALAAERGLDLLTTADHARAARAGHTRRAAATAAPQEDAIAIRLARPADGPALARLAALDDHAEQADRLAGMAGEPWDRGILVAEVDGTVAAALVVQDGTIVADPFRRTALLVDLLRLRAEQLTGRSWLATALPRAAAVLHPRLH